MKAFKCTCSQTLFFENSLCGSCGREVGWCPQCRSITGLDALDDGRYRCGHASCGATLAKCANYARENVCNRCVSAPDGATAPELCDYCRYNDTVPDLSVDGNRERWARLETAKRRLLYSLDLLGLPHGTAAEGFDPPLAFAFMGDVEPDGARWQPGKEGEKIFTGHADGLITINIREADDAEREAMRVGLGESHRTLIGHFRHEIAHYYWDLLVRGRHEPAFKERFGDHENPTYEEALKRHYETGAPAGWQANFISAYATMHPWEDWAETFALFLDMAGILDTAASIGLTGPVPWDDLKAMVDRYRLLGIVFNEINREMGLLDLVPEVITEPIVEKLGFVHDRAREVWSASGRV